MRKIIALAVLLGALSFGSGAFAQATNGPALYSVNGGQNILKVISLPSGQVMVGQGVNIDPLAAPITGDCTLAANGAITCTKTNGTVLGTAATATTGVSGATVPLNNSANVFSALNTFTGHIAGGTSPPVLTSCGTGPSILGDDKDGQVTMGTTATGCVITFAAAYTATPLCVVIWQATPLASQSYAVSNTALTLTQTSTSSNKVNYHCTAQNGG